MDQIKDIKEAVDKIEDKVKNQEQAKLSLPRVWKKVTEKYDLIQKIGSGSYGLLVKAQNKKTGEIVAIKQITCLDEDDQLYKAIIREVHILRKLSSIEGNKNTTKLIDIIASKDFTKSETPYLFFVMEYMSADLHKMLDNSK